MLRWHHRAVPENHFKAKIATEYATLWPHLFEPAMVDPPVSFLADMAQGGAVLSSASARADSACRSAVAASRSTESSCRPT